MLKTTRIGILVNKLKKAGENEVIKERCAELIGAWKEMAAKEEAASAASASSNNSIASSAAVSDN